MKQAILVVSYGSSHPSSIDTSIGHIEQKLEETFLLEKKALPVYRAFTSPMVIHSLKERYGYIVPTVEESIEHIKEDGITHLFIVPTHFLPGTSYTSIGTSIGHSTSYFEEIQLGTPLLLDSNHYETLIQTLKTIFPCSDANQATIFLAHGSNHTLNTYYKKLEDKFHQLGYTNHFILTIADLTNFDEVCKQLNLSTYEHIHIAPLLFTTGHHTLRDLCGEGEGSLASLLFAKGLHVTCSPKGLGEYEEFQDMFIERIKKSSSYRFR